MRRKDRAMKKLNNYALAIEGYDKIPKAVFAAIAFSYATCGGDHWEYGTNNILDEWEMLHANGIVPQKPPRRQK
jgi:hypothetical protein